jgi:hypothetical protein
MSASTTPARINPAGSGDDLWALFVEAADGGLGLAGRGIFLFSLLGAVVDVEGWPPPFPPPKGR